MRDIKMHFKKKFADKHGMTLAETLIAVLILLLASLIVATGLPAVQNAYEKTVLASNADILLSTAISSLRNELDTATNIQINPTTHEITYYNQRRGTMSRIYMDSIDAESPTTILIQQFTGGNQFVPGKESTPVSLVSKTTSKQDLNVTYDNAVYDPVKNTITFENLQINKATGKSGLSKRDKLTIHIVA